MIYTTKNKRRIYKSYTQIITHRWVMKHVCVKTFSHIDLQKANNTILVIEYLGFQLEQVCWLSFAKQLTHQLRMKS